MSVVGDILRKAREAAGLNKTQAGRLVGSDYQRWHAWETGRSLPRRSIDDILQILQAVGRESEARPRSPRSR